MLQLLFWNKLQNKCVLLYVTEWYLKGYLFDTANFAFDEVSIEHYIHYLVPKGYDSKYILFWNI